MEERKEFGIHDGLHREMPLLWEQFNDDVKTLHLRDSAVKGIPQDELNSGLIRACLTGHRVNVQLFLQWGAALESKDQQGNTPLLISAEKGFTDIVDLLLQKGADVNASNMAGDTPLILSIRSPGSLETMKLILKQRLIDIEHRNHAGYTALMTAIEEIDIKAIKLLLDANASLDGKLKTTQGVRDFSSTEEIEGEGRTTTGLTAQILADTLGLGTLMDYLKIPEKSEVSPLQRAVLSGDFKHVCLLLDSQLSYIRFLSPDSDIITTFIKSKVSSRSGVTEDDIAIVEKLIDSIVYTNGSFSLPVSDLPIETAVMLGSYKLIQIMCQWYIRRPLMISAFTPSLLTAAEYGHCDIAQLLLQYPEQLAKNGLENIYSQALSQTFFHGHIECQKILLPLCNPSKRQCIELLSDAICSENLDFMKLLSEHQPSIRQLVRTQNKYHKNMLILAVETGNLEIVQLILDWGADVNLEIYNSRTPLTYALSIKTGADADQIIGNNHTGPLLNLCQRRNPHILVKLLLDAGADVGHCDTNGNSALHFAVRSRSLENVKSLVSHHADVNAATKTGSTGLMEALMLGEIDIVECLINHGADVNVQDTQGKSMLFFALFARFNFPWDAIRNPWEHRHVDLRYIQPRLLSILLQKGADVNAGRWEGGSVLKTILNTETVGEEFVNCAELLLFYGADPRGVDPIVIHKLLPRNQFGLIKKLTYSGILPTDRAIENERVLSPLARALIGHNFTMVNHFIRRWYLTRSDLVSLRHDYIRMFPARNTSFKILDDFCFQPRPLQMLSFLTISFALGTSRDRVASVEKLPLPVHLKEKLCYKKKIKKEPRAVAPFFLRHIY